jgi:hypothetical protein
MSDETTTDNGREALTLPKPTDVREENVKYNAVMYRERRFGPPKHVFSSPFGINTDVQLYGWLEIRASSSNQVIRNPRRTSQADNTSH